VLDVKGASRTHHAQRAARRYTDELKYAVTAGF
jgi:hypothetical protein